MDASGQLRNLRDFLLVYNRMTELCFQRCTSNFNYRNLTMDEERCVDSCAGKLIRTNHRLMGTYVQLMPAMVQKRMQEMESKAAELEKAAAQAGALEHASAAGTDTQPVSPLNPGIPAVEIPTTAADHALPSGLGKTAPLVFEPASETANLSVPFTSTNEASSSTVSSVTHNTQTLTATDSLQGPMTVTSVMTSSTGSSVPSPKVSEGSGSGPAV